MADPATENTGTTLPTGLSSPTAHILDRSANSHREASSPRPTTHETHTVASQKQLKGTRVPRKGHTYPKVAPPASQMVATGRPYASRSTIIPTKTGSANLYRCINRRVGHSLKRAHCKGSLVHSRRQAAHKLSGKKGGHLGAKRVPRPLLEQQRATVA